MLEVARRLAPGFGGTAVTVKGSGFELGEHGTTFVFKKSGTAPAMQDLVAGQIDVFYLNRAPYLVVFETYSSDAVGNRFVPTFQRILDSLSVKTGT